MADECDDFCAQNNCKGPFKFRGHCFCYGWPTATNGEWLALPPQTSMIYDATIK